MDENYKALYQLYTEVTKYVEKRQEKLKLEVEQKQNDLIEKIAKMLAED